MVADIASTVDNCQWLPRLDQDGGRGTARVGEGRVVDQATAARMAMVRDDHGRGAGGKCEVAAFGGRPTQN